MQIDLDQAVEPNLSTLLDAAQREPVFLQRGSRGSAVIISAERYEQIRQAAIDELNELCDTISDRAQSQGMTDSELEELLKND